MATTKREQHLGRLATEFKEPETHACLFMEYREEILAMFFEQLEANKQQGIPPSDFFKVAEKLRGNR